VQGSTQWDHRQAAILSGKKNSKLVDDEVKLDDVSKVRHFLSNDDDKVKLDEVSKVRNLLSNYTQNQKQQQQQHQQLMPRLSNSTQVLMPRLSDRPTSAYSYTLTQLHYAITYFLPKVGTVSSLFTKD
jgi:hypothetical protein